MFTYTFDRPRGGARNFYLWGQVETLIYLSEQPPHTYIHTLFYYVHTFLFDKLYIYTHQTTTKRV